MIEWPALARDLATFADLGTDPPEPVLLKDVVVFRLFREGEQIELRFHDQGAGKVIERSLDDGIDRKHASYRALLATERFGNLRRWADNQRKSFQEIDQADYMEIKGTISSDDTDPPVDLTVDWNGLDDYLVSQARSEDSVRIMLIDGPAGIGKTTFIEALTRSRAENFLQPMHRARRPLILHVQSRGRVLTFLQDLIAFSLQRLRLAVTFDQVPVLVRHGLVTMAIDGFDELADPNGYDLAWGQVNELVDQVRGVGTLILAGRETFFDRKRVRDNIVALRPQDGVDDLSLQLPAPTAAKQWLVRHGEWTEETIEEDAGILLEHGSYALRPVFLRQLATPEAFSIIRDSYAQSTLSFLVELMVRREAGKFGDAVETVMDEEQRRRYVWSFLQEVARHLADDQTEAIEDRVVAWLAEFAAPEGTTQETLGILQNRVAVMAFLANDDLPGYRRFLHSQVFNHVLANVTIDTISKEEMPKYIRRNLLGADFLTSVSDLILYQAKSNSKRVRGFFDAASRLLRSYSWIDRGVRNIGALLVAMLPALDGSGDLSIRNIQVDEALIQGTVPTSSIRAAVISQLDVRGSDLRNLTFDATTIVTLIADDATRVSSTFPIPDRIQVEGSDLSRGAVLAARDKIIGWLNEHGRGCLDHTDGSIKQSAGGLVPFELRDHHLMILLGRACRIKSHSFTEDSDYPFQKFTQDMWWPDIRRLLKNHGFLEESTKQTSGPRKTLFHIRRAKDLLAAELDLPPESQDDEIRQFYESLVKMMREN